MSKKKETLLKEHVERHLLHSMSSCLSYCMPSVCQRWHKDTFMMGLAWLAWLKRVSGDRQATDITVDTRRSN